MGYEIDSTFFLCRLIFGLGASSTSPSRTLISRVSAVLTATMPIDKYITFSTFAN